MKNKNRLHIGADIRRSLKDSLSSRNFPLTCPEEAFGNLNGCKLFLNLILDEILSCWQLIQAVTN